MEGLKANVKQTVQDLSWVLILQLSTIELSHHLGHVDLILDTALAQLFLAQDKLQTLLSRMQELQSL